MAVESRRKCGYRKVGGLYLVSPPGGFSCGRLPVPLVPCPTCSAVPTFNRALMRIVPAELLHSAPPCLRRFSDFGPEVARGSICGDCPFDRAAAQLVGGLSWIGELHYPHPDDFNHEAAMMGVSKRISQVPGPWFQLGKTWIYLAHSGAVPDACQPADHPHTDCERCDGRGWYKRPAIVRAFVPTRLEKIVTGETPEAELAELRAAGITPVLVPADDPDHQPGRSNRERKQPRLEGMSGGD